jgi:heptaprenyl diphosphate synthase
MSSFWERYPELERELQEVRDLVGSTVPAGSGAVQDSIREFLGSSGKMLRPGFVLIASRFGVPRDATRLRRLAAAVELLHLATLVHDDIIDAAPMRRGAATLHARHGVRAAVLAGDTLFASSLSLAAEYADGEVLRSFPRLVSRICDGEIAQSADRREPSRSVRRYLRRIEEKTALLFAMSFAVGAREAGCPPEVSQGLQRLGWCLGMGFQVIDDLLDFDGVGTETGKPVARDLAEGTYTLPVVLALRADDGRLERFLLARSAAPGPLRGWNARRLREARRLIEERGGLAGARRQAMVYTDRARREIDRLPDCEARRTLAAIAEALLHRSR